MSRGILFSVSPQYAEKIVDGAKKVEFRRGNILNVPDFAVIYATSPMRRIVAVLRVEAVRREAPATLWAKFKHRGGISEIDFWHYFTGAGIGTAVELGEIMFKCSLPYSSLKLGSRPPQSFRYLQAECLTALSRQRK